jgi:FkbM family methyltransferase
MARDGARRLARAVRSLLPLFAGLPEMQESERWWSALLERLHRETSAVFFVEVGANDGHSFDPIHEHVVRHGWNGIVIEPLPDLFKQLVECYRRCPGVILENVAISEEAGERQMYRVSPNAMSDGALPSWTKGLGSFFTDRNALGGVGVSAEQFEAIRPHVTTQTVRCRPLGEVLLQHRVAKLDLLQIDVEGYDYHVLQQLDWQRFSPRVIRMEWVNLPAHEQQASLALLQSQRYELRLTETDLIAFRHE